MKILDHKLRLDWVDSTNPPNQSQQVLKFSMGIKITEPLIMFHVCYLYHLYKKQNIIDINKQIDVNSIMISIAASIEYKIQNGNTDFIDEIYSLIKSDEKQFDECLGIFSRIYNEIKNYKNDSIVCT